MLEREPKPNVHQSRLLADLERAVSAGHVLQATTVAALIGRNAYELVNQSLRIPGTRGGSVDERLQSHLRNIVTLLGIAERHFGDVMQAVHWYVTAHGVDAAPQSPETLIACGNVDDAYRLLLRARRSSTKP